MSRLAFVLPVLLLAAGAAVPQDNPKYSLVLHLQERSPAETITTIDPKTKAVTTVRFSESVTASEAKYDPKETAVIICDMWDDHWCKSAAARCGELAKKAEPVLKACRDRGITIIHAPSDCMKFYEDHPARKRMLAIKKVELPKEKDVKCPALPIDDSDGGCDDATPAKQFKAWTRQHAAITIDADRDYISDNGHEVYSLLKEKKIGTLLVMGVHTNMCVLNRSFAIKQMVKWGVQTYLIRDLTDTMYNPKMRPLVPHEKGTDLVIQYIETYWCPTLESKDLLLKK